jgi:hypothetical protein
VFLRAHFDHASPRRLHAFGQLERSCSLGSDLRAETVSFRHNPDPGKPCYCERLHAPPSADFTAMPAILSVNDTMKRA